MFENYKLHHVGLISPSLQDAETLMKTMGFREDYRGFVEPWSCWCIFTRAATDSVIEIVVPEGGPLAKFNKGLGGVHHFAFEVDDIAKATHWAEQQGMRMVEPKAIKGAGDFWCNFLSPASTRGVQIEFVEPFRK